MAQGSGIEWTESTWNPITGCTKVSPGCKFCYAERMAERLQAMGQPNYKDGFKLTLQPKMLELPLQWKKPQTIFPENGVAEPGVLRNSSNNPLYLLCFAAGNDKGAPIAVKIANHILKEAR